MLHGPAAASTIQPYWVPAHVAALAGQTLSISSALIFVYLWISGKQERTIYRRHVLNISLSDFLWTTIHMANHIQFLIFDSDQINTGACSFYATGTFFGMGSSEFWLCSLAIYNARLTYYGTKGRKAILPEHYFSILTCICWGVPFLWWVVLANILKIYNPDDFFFCGVENSPPYYKIMFVDGPILITFFVISCCYIYSGFSIMAFRRKFSMAAFSSHRNNPENHDQWREIKKSSSFVIVYLLWAQSLLSGTFMMLAGTDIPGLYWPFYFFFANLLGALNFSMYGISEGWLKLRKRTLLGTSLRALLLKDVAS